MANTAALAERHRTLTMPRHHLHRKRKRGKRTYLTIYIISAVLGIWFVSNFFFFFNSMIKDDGNDQKKATDIESLTKTTKNLRAFSKHIQENEKSQVRSHSAEEVNLSSPWILPNEKIFFETVTSCIPSDVATHITRRESENKKEKCLQHIPAGTKAQRIGILSPPGTIADEFYGWVVDMLAKYFQENPDKAKLNTEIELVSTSHVPPYGYGKNHGWTKIIRFVADPIDIGAVDSILHEGGERLQKTFVSFNGEMTSSPSPDNAVARKMVSSAGVGSDSELMVELSSTLSQIVRWNCRLSHVSAHTALLTVTLQDLINEPSRAASDVLSFIFATGEALEDNDNSKNELVGANIQWIKNIDTAKLKQRMDYVMKHGKSLFERTHNDLVSIVTNLNLTLRKELESTNNLKDWPCKSLWDVDSNTVSTKERAKSLAPNCSADYTRCTILKDGCEERGETVCENV